MEYINRVFDVTSLDQAKYVVLTPDQRNPNKFESETNYFINILGTNLLIDQHTKVLDFGCGMGRISKKLISAFDCNVFGVDISESMLAFAHMYVNNSNKFKTANLYNIANSIDLCICTFVLQHAENPIKEIQNIYNVLADNGVFVLLNEKSRLIPSEITEDNYIKWSDDNIDVHHEVSKLFEETVRVRYMNSDLEVIFYIKKEK